MAPSYLIGIVLVASVLSAINGADVTVNAPYAGNITGVTENVSGMTLNKFLGIPYADPPKRFQRPKMKAMSNIQAKSFGDFCMQKMDGEMLNGNGDPMAPGKMLTSEDCLTLNIYAPTGKTDMAVIVFIHGGYFTRGGSATIDGRYISAYNDVVFVTFNYRLGIFGFLSTDDKNAVGNYGLYDQHMAIHWVRKNIHAFGGDRKRITVMGSVSAVLQSASPFNKGKIRRLINQGGSYSSSWAFAKKPEETAQKVGQVFNCSDESAALVTCLNGESAASLLNASLDMMWGPVYDDHFVIDDVCEKLSSDDCNLPRALFGMVDALIGSTRNSGKYALHKILAANNIALMNVPKDVFENILIPNVTKTLEIKDADEVKRMLTKLYGVKVGNNHQSAIEMITDRNYLTPALQTVLVHAENEQKKSSYFYTYDYSGNMTTAPPISQLLAEPGNETTEEKMTKVLQIYWTNFAKSGNPNRPVTGLRQWSQFTTENHEYIRLGGSSEYGIVINNNEKNPRNKYAMHWLKIFDFERDYLKDTMSLSKTPLVMMDIKFPNSSTTSCQVDSIRLGGPIGPHLRSVDVDAIVLGLSVATGLGVVLFIVLLAICCDLLRSVRDLRKSSKAAM